MNSPLVLVLLCGLCLTALGPADANVHQDIQKLTEYFNITADLSLFGGPIFLQDIVSHDKVEKSEQMLVLQESLVVYIRILSDMLNSTQDREIKMSIIAIRGRMEHLWSSYFHNRPDALLGRLQELWYLKTSDATVQRKAVRELPAVLQRAFELCGKSAPRRRRNASLAQLQRS